MQANILGEQSQRSRPSAAAQAETSDSTPGLVRNVHGDWIEEPPATTTEHDAHTEACPASLAELLALTATLVHGLRANSLIFKADAAVAALFLLSGLSVPDALARLRSVADTPSFYDGRTPNN